MFRSRQSPAKRPRSWRRNVVTAAIGATIWGAWAWYTNRADGGGSGICAALVQAMLAAGIVFFKTWSVEYWARYGRRMSARVLYAVAGTFAVILPVSVLAHWLAGTPRILVTIAPALLVGVAACIGYALALPAAETWIDESMTGSGEHKP